MIVKAVSTIADAIGLMALIVITAAGLFILITAVICMAVIYLQKGWYMQSIIIWGRQIFIVCIISNIFIRLVPSQKYEKYIKYICGIILLVIMYNTGA